MGISSSTSVSRDVMVGGPPDTHLPEDKDFTIPCFFTIAGPTVGDMIAVYDDMTKCTERVQAKCQIDAKYKEVKAVCYGLTIEDAYGKKRAISVLISLPRCNHMTAGSILRVLDPVRHEKSEAKTALLSVTPLTTITNGVDACTYTEGDGKEAVTVVMKNDSKLNSVSIYHELVAGYAASHSQTNFNTEKGPVLTVLASGTAGMDKPNTLLHFTVALDKKSVPDELVLASQLIEAKLRAGQHNVLELQFVKGTFY